MRDILFRGKPNERFKDFLLLRKEYNEEGFVHGSLVLAEENRAYICIGGYCSNRSIVNNGRTTMVEVIPETVGQYTGLKDKNGKKIFEGDIVKTVEGPFKVVCEHGAFWLYDELLLSNDHLDFLGSYKTETIEVIGNVYDNPELLEVK